MKTQIRCKHKHCFVNKQPTGVFLLTLESHLPNGKKKNPETKQNISKKNAGTSDPGNVNN